MFNVICVLSLFGAVLLVYGGILFMLVDSFKHKEYHHTFFAGFFLLLLTGLLSGFLGSVFK